jgi:hypothetical protein
MLSNVAILRWRIIFAALAVMALALDWARFTACWGPGWRFYSVMVVSFLSALCWALSAALSFEDEPQGGWSIWLLDVERWTNFFAAVLTGAALLMQAMYNNGCVKR